MTDHIMLCKPLYFFSVFCSGPPLTCGSYLLTANPVGPDRKMSEGGMRGDRPHGDGVPLFCLRCGQQRRGLQASQGCQRKGMPHNIIP